MAGGDVGSQEGGNVAAWQCGVVHCEEVVVKRVNIVVEVGRIRPALETLEKRRRECRRLGEYGIVRGKERPRPFGLDRVREGLSACTVREGLSACTMSKKGIVSLLVLSNIPEHR